LMKRLAGYRKRRQAREMGREECLIVHHVDCVTTQQIDKDLHKLC
jgi:hypothetical protein